MCHNHKLLCFFDPLVNYYISINSKRKNYNISTLASPIINRRVGTLIMSPCIIVQLFTNYQSLITFMDLKKSLHIKNQTKKPWTCSAGSNRPGHYWIICYVYFNTWLIVNNFPPFQSVIGCEENEGKYVLDTLYDTFQNYKYLKFHQNLEC